MQVIHNWNCQTRSQSRLRNLETRGQSRPEKFSILLNALWLDWIRVEVEWGFIFIKISNHSDSKVRFEHLTYTEQSIKPYIMNNFIRRSHRSATSEYSYCVLLGSKLQLRTYNVWIFIGRSVCTVLYSWCAAAIVTEVSLQLLWNKLFLSKCIVMQCKCSYSISKPKMFSFNKDKCENTVR